MFVDLPTKSDNVSGGRESVHPTDPNIYEILTWMNYSAKTGEYHGRVTTWQFAEYNDPKTGTKKLGAFLLNIALKNPYSDLVIINCGQLKVSEYRNMIADLHIRRIGIEGRKRTNLLRFDNIIFHPPKREWLVNPTDQVIVGSHTSTMR